VPVDAVLNKRDAVAERTVSLDNIIQQLESEDHETIILLDACRDNPLPESVRSKQDGQGLAMVTSGSNTYIAFATRPGGITADGKGDHGPFAAALAEGMTYPDVPISGMMTRVRHAVWTETNNVQEPWSNDTLHEEFFFNGGDAEAGVTLASAEEPALDSLFDTPATVAPTPTKIVPPTTTAATQPKPTPAQPAPTGPAPSDVASLGGTSPTPGTATQPKPTAASPLPQSSLPASTTAQPATAPQPGTTSAAPATDVASLGGTTAPTLQPLQSSAPSVLGVELPEGGTEPGLPGLPEGDVPAIDVVKVASLMQQELSRIGCYFGTVDGDWGTGSKNALRRYFAAKKESVPGTDPSQELLTRLTDEGGKVCEPPPPKVAKPKPPAGTPGAPTTATGKGKASGQPKVASEPSAPATGKPKLKLGAGTGTFR
jgi:hypothetical protein